MFKISLIASLALGVKEIFTKNCSVPHYFLRDSILFAAVVICVSIKHVMKTTIFILAYALAT